MADQVTIARVTFADRADWERLWKDWQHHMSGRVPDDVTQKSWEMMMREESGLYALLARDGGGRAVGFANISRTPFAWTGSPILFLQDLYIDEPVRGDGVGSALLTAAYALGDELGASQVFWMVDEDDQRLQGFYARHGIRTPYLRYMRRPWPCSRTSSSGMADRGDRPKG